MNEKFFELPKEKQMNIITAAIEVFGANDYKRAVTDSIAAKAGISKGLLFYYFHNKKGLYMYVYQYCYTIMKELIIDEHFQEIDDFFELLEYGANKKVMMLSKYPGITEFVMRAYYSQNEAISDDVASDMQVGINESYGLFFKNINMNKFKEGCDIAYMYRMLVWMTDGFLHEKQANHIKVDLDEVMDEFKKWKQMFRTMVYKEEFL